MVNNVVDNVQTLLISIIILETAIIIGEGFNRRSLQFGQRNENVNSPFYGFEFYDYVQLAVYGLFFLFGLYVIFFYALPLHASVSQLMVEKGVENILPYLSFTMSFIAISITTLVFGFNLVTGSISRIHERNRYRELCRRLDTLQQITEARNQ